MNVTFTAANKEKMLVYISAMYANKRVIGTAKNIEISLSKNQTAQAIIFPQSEDDEYTYEVQQTDIAMEKFDFGFIGGTGNLRKSLEATETVVGLFKVADGKESGKVSIKSEKSIDTLSAYDVSDKPVFAKSEQNGVSEIDPKGSNIGLIV